MPDVSEDIKPANPRIFAPSETKANEVLNALACGHYSFVDIAQNHDTNVEALSAWMATDEIAQRLAVIESGPARQARFVATLRMPDAVRALTAALDNLRFEEEHAVTDHRNQRIRELRRRGADTLRKIVALLHRITRFEPHRVTVPRATACSPSSATSSAGCHTRPEPPSTPSDPSVPLDLLDPSPPSTNSPAPITPESIEELRSFLSTLLTPSSPSVTSSLDHSVTSPPSPPHPSTSAPPHPTSADTLPQTSRTKPVSWKSTLHSRTGTTRGTKPPPPQQPESSIIAPQPAAHSNGNHSEQAPPDTTAPP